MSNEISDIAHPLKYTFGYATGFIFLLGIVIYLYLLIMDHLENNNQHSLEETVWIYLFLVILIIGFFISYYTITCSIYCLKNSNLYKENINRRGFSFGGKNNIPSKPSIGQQNIRFSKFMV
jgi:undecaprenyl pyrophosphate phosphatase UppP